MLLEFLLGALAPTLAAQMVTVTNVTTNNYAYTYFPGACPAGIDLPPGQFPSSNHLERSHVIYNHRTGQWVYWAHYDSANYGLAQVLVATSANECGPYTVQSEFAPAGLQSRDENIFEDEDGSAYLIFASNKNGGANDTMGILKMTPDYLAIDTGVPVTWLFENAYREAPAVIKKDGVYYLITSQAAGWFPSQAGYAVGTAMMPASAWGPLKPLGNTSTFGGQSADTLTIKGTAATTYLVAFDHLGGNALHDTGSMYLPVLLDTASKTATLNWYTSFQVDMTSGVLTLPTMTDVATSGTATSSVPANPANPPSLAIDGNYQTQWASATGGPSAFPGALTIDLGSSKHIEEVDLSWSMVKGSEPYYKYTIGYSDDGTNYTTLDYTGNILYGFTHDAVDFTARYVRITETGFVCQNGCQFYGPGLYEASLIQAPPSLNLPVTVSVQPSATAVSGTQTLSVDVTVSGPSNQPVPSGTVTLTGGGYTATYGLVGGHDRFTIPASALTAGYDALTATYTPDPTSAPIYGTASTAASTAPIKSGTIPAAPTNLSVSASKAGELIATWSASPSAVSYLLERSINNGASVALATTEATSYIDTGLVNNSVVYCYSVYAVNALGTGPGAPAVCGTPLSSFLAVPNFSFETPATSSYIYNPGNAAWAFMPSSSTGGSGITTNASPFTTGDAAAPDGTQVAFLQMTGSAVQTFGGFTVGRPYKVMVSASQRQNYSNPTGNTFDIRVNGATIGSFAPPQAIASFLDYSATFTATSATNTLALVGTNLLAPGVDNTVFVDNVRILGIGTKAVAIKVQPIKMLQGSTPTLLIARASFDDGSVPQGTMVFQVNAGQQVAGTCAKTTMGAAICTASYPTASLPVGTETITAVYAGDGVFAPATASATLTIAPH